MFLNHSDALGRGNTTSRRNGRKQVSSWLGKCFHNNPLLCPFSSSTPRADERSYCATPRSFYSNRTPLRERYLTFCIGDVTPIDTVLTPMTRPLVKQSKAPNPATSRIKSGQVWYRVAKSGCGQLK